MTKREMMRLQAITLEDGSFKAEVVEVVDVVEIVEVVAAE